LLARAPGATLPRVSSTRPRNLTSATTRSMRSPAVPLERGRHLLSPAQLVTSPESQITYRVERLLGEGGFGQVYLARRHGTAKEDEALCIKISPRMDGWLREAYFGQLLDDHPRAIRVFDVFPWMPRAGEVFYCLALEYARHGDLRAFLRRGAEGWPERRVRREIAGVLAVLGKLHRGQTLHRDLTPLNVFVCEGPTLKLGDFGIARQQSDRRGITVRGTMSALTAPSDILDGAVPKWQARDDVYQVGQLIGMLVKGDAGARVRTREIRGLSCSDQLKEIIHRCIGERRKRYESADELIQALRKPAARLEPGALRSLNGVHLAFTGILTRKRSEAAQAAKRAGAIVHGAPSARTTVVVRGRPNVLQAAGKDGGLKLMEIKRLREKGHRITLLDESRFWRLASKGRTR
jgi:serine/threonine protein kinase